jgi:hypothetical protein
MPTYLSPFTVTVKSFHHLEPKHSMGLSRSDLNLEVAKRENSVILLEDNFKDTYQGFDPNNRVIDWLTILQEENLNNSIILANEIKIISPII